MGRTSPLLFRAGLLGLDGGVCAEAIIASVPTAAISDQKCICQSV
jgi:hypothetical protein